MLRLARSFRFAFAGLTYLTRTQPNFRIELALGSVAVALALWLGFTATEWAVLATIVALVLILEGVNTALELTVDLASPAVHPKARAAKDVAAGTVLIASTASVACGALLFGPRLLSLLD